jgi:copper chaperone
MGMLKLKVSGMSCNHCVRSVESVLAEVSGVDRVVEVSLERGEALLEGDPAHEALVAAVRGEGYEAEVVS